MKALELKCIFLLYNPLLTYFSHHLFNKCCHSINIKVLAAISLLLINDIKFEKIFIYIKNHSLLDHLLLTGHLHSESVSLLTRMRARFVALELESS